MKFEDKVNLGKEAIGKLRAGMDMSDIFTALVMTCVVDTVTCPDGEEADPIELIILGANEDTIERTANELYEGVIKADDAGKMLEYKQMVSSVKELAKKIGNPEVVGNFLPVHTLVGMAMIRAGERLMGIEGTNRAAEKEEVKDEDNKEEK